MESFEKIGEAFEQPTEKPMNIEGPQKKSESSELYDEAEWKRIKRDGYAVAFDTFNKGKEMGVPKEELDRFAKDVIAQEVRNLNYVFVYRFRKLTGIESSHSPEDYKPAQWEHLKKNMMNRDSPAYIIAMGSELGVPQNELDQYAEEVIRRETENKNYDFIYRFRAAMGIGTSEDLRMVGEQMYDHFLETVDVNNAVRNITEEMYGKESKQYQKVDQAMRSTSEFELRSENRERELRVRLSKDTTFADLFKAIDEIEKKEGLDAVHFWEELWDNFDQEIGEEILSLQGIDADRAARTKLIDFFKERGYTQRDVSIFLPITFRRERKKK